MRLRFGDDGGAGDGRARNRDLCHRVGVRSGDLIFVWPDVVALARAEFDLAAAVPNGGGDGGNRYQKAVESV